MAKQNKQKRKVSFFEQQVQQYGTGWLYRLNTEQIRKFAINIFKDIAFGNVEPQSIVEYFKVPDFVYNLIAAAQDNAMYHFYTYQGLSNVASEGSDMIKVARTHYEGYLAYSAVIVNLNNILTDINSTGGIYIPSLISSMIITLQPYKHNFNGTYITIPKDGDTRMRLKREIGGNSGYDKGINNSSEDAIWGQPN